MPTLNFTPPQRAQLIGWLNREKDFLISLDSLSRRILIPKTTGSDEMIARDLDIARSLRSKIASHGETVELTEDECEILVMAAEFNSVDDRKEMWEEVIKVIKESR